jgi:hypothetical protein
VLGTKRSARPSKRREEEEGSGRVGRKRTMSQTPNAEQKHASLNWKTEWEREERRRKRRKKKRKKRREKSKKRRKTKVQKKDTEKKQGERRWKRRKKKRRRKVWMNQLPFSLSPLSPSLSPSPSLSLAQSD